MATFLEQLQAMGNKAIDLALGPVRDAITNLSNKSVQIERLYNQWYEARDTFEKAGKSFPYETQFNSLSDAVKKERSTRILLLRGMYKVSANPKDYGLSVYGLSRSEIIGTYSGLKYNAADARLGAIPLVVIDAAVIVTVIGVVVYLEGVLSDVSKVNILSTLQKFYMDQGKSAPDALNQASADLKAANPESPSIFDGLGNAAKWGAAAIAGLLAYSMFK